MKTAPVFRGMRVDNGEWVEGHFDCYINNGRIVCLINEHEGFHCDPATVEQIAGDAVEEIKRLKEHIKMLEEINKALCLRQSIDDKRLYELAPWWANPALPRPVITYDSSSCKPE